MYQYDCYGLRWQSDLELPELSTHPGDIATCGNQRPRLRIRVEPPSGVRRDDWNPHPQVAVVRESVFLNWEGVASFEVCCGAEIVVTPAVGVSHALLARPLLGPVLAVALHQRGYLILHASAVAHPTGVIAFLGQKGAGKSTTAAFLSQRGCEVLSDDLVVLDVCMERPVSILRGFPSLKLWSDSADTAFGAGPQVLHRVVNETDKRVFATPVGSSNEVQPLSAIYLLTVGTAPSVEELLPQSVMTHLIGHSYASRFGSALLHGSDAARHLWQCGQTASTVPIRRLTRPDSLDRVAAFQEVLWELLPMGTPRDETR